jgi:hypothetical protein
MLMPKKLKCIPVNPLAEGYEAGIAIRKIASPPVSYLDEGVHSHRHDLHLFLLLEKGNAHM